jgi:HAD superfamily hydrolase (TIGR01549 family)
MIKLVTFDLDDTLWDAGPILRAAEEKQFAWIYQQVPEFSSGMPRSELSQIRKQLVRQNPLLIHNLTELRRKILATALVQIGLDTSTSESLAHQAVQVFLQGRHEVSYFKHSIEVLEELSGQYTLAALSNGNADIRRLEIGKYFSISYSSADVGTSKPAPDMFLAALNHLGITADEAVHVGDHPENDVRAAAQAGLGAIWLNIAGQTPPQGVAYREVECLSEIPDCLTTFNSSL